MGNNNTAPWLLSSKCITSRWGFQSCHRRTIGGGCGSTVYGGERARHKRSKHARCPEMHRGSRAQRRARNPHKSSVTCSARYCNNRSDRSVGSARSTVQSPTLASRIACTCGRCVVHSDLQCCNCCAIVSFILYLGTHALPSAKINCSQFFLLHQNNTPQTPLHHCAAIGRHISAN